MRQAALQSSSPRTQVARTVSMSAPIGGLNARDSYAAMKPTDAILLDNFFCLPSKVILRAGSTDWATGITGTVETVAGYNAALSSKLFAAAGANIYDVTSAGAVGAAVQTGLSSGRWQFTNFATPGGQFLYLVNGIDKPRLYNGAAWIAVDGASTPAITGVTTTLLTHVCAHKQRLWFVEINSLRAWYLPAQNVGGAAQPYDLSSFFPAGGYLMAIGTWTIDGGYGMDDNLVFVSSQGEVAVYRGTDPASASTWALVGLYQIGTPLGRRCMMKYGGDLLIISKDGVLPLSQTLISSRTNQRVALTDKIQQLVSADTSVFGANFGWELCLNPPDNMLIVNVPLGTGAAKQYAMNTISGAWSSFSGWNAATFELWGDGIYFGTSGKVVKALSGTDDSSSNINGNALQAFSSFGRDSQLKFITEARPLLSYDNAPGVLIGMNFDFDTSDPIGSPSFAPLSAAAWDSATWDSSTWGGAEQIQRNWQTVGGVGYWAAMHIKTASAHTKLSWYSTDIVMQGGAVI